MAFCGHEATLAYQPLSRRRRPLPGRVSFATLASLAGGVPVDLAGGVNVDLGLLQAREDLLEERLVLGRVLPQPLVHLLHLPAEAL